MLRPSTRYLNPKEPTKRVKGVDHECYGVHAFDCDGTESGHEVQIQACVEGGVFQGSNADNQAQVALIMAAERGESWAIRELAIFLDVILLRYRNIEGRRTLSVIEEALAETGP